MIPTGAPRPKKSKPKSKAKKAVPRKEIIVCPKCQGEAFYGANPCDRCNASGQIEVTRTRPIGAKLPRDNGNHPGGRTPKHNPETVAILCDCISRGMSYQSAANTAGIGLSTLEEWIASDTEFAGAIKKAAGERERDRVAYIEGCGENWQAIAWLLERCHGNKYAPPKTTVRNEHVFTPGMEDDDLKEAKDLLGMM